MGSTGEVSMLSQQEVKQVVVETAKNEKLGASGFFTIVTGNNTQTTMDYLAVCARQSEPIGAILAAPSYICAPEDAIEDFFMEVARRD